MFKKIFILVLFLLPSFNNCFPQVIEEWFQTYGGGFTPNLTEDFTIDSSGNSYLVGDVSRNWSESVNAIGTVKYNSSGVLQWVKLYQGSRGRSDQAKGVIVDKIGNVYVTGNSEDIDSSENYCTIKYRPNGEIAWVRKFQAALNSRDFATDICMDNTGYLYVTGHTQFVNEYYINTIKYDTSGNMIWATRFDEYLNNRKESRSITIDSMNNVYVTGNISNDYYTIKYNSDGLQQWVSYFDNSNLIDKPTEIRVDKQGNVYVLGKSFLDDLYYNEYYTTMLKYSNSGNQIWVYKTDSIGFSGNYYSLKMSFRIDTGSNVYFATSYKKSSSLIKIDSNGKLLWNAKYDGRPTFVNALGRAVEIDKQGFIYVNGTVTKLLGASNYCTLKYNADGSLLWVRTFHSHLESDDLSAFIRVNNTGDVYVAGIIYNPVSVTKFGVVKYSQGVGINNISSEIPVNYDLYQNYPNPFNPMTVIRYSLIENRFTTLKVFDALGKIVSTLVNEEQNTGTYEMEFDGNDLASGVYYYKLSSGDFSQTKRMLLLK